MNRECHFQTEDETELIKSKSVMTKSFISENIITQRLHNNVVSIINTYIHKYINPQPSEETMQQCSIIRYGNLPQGGIVNRINLTC